MSRHALAIALPPPRRAAGRADLEQVGAALGGPEPLIPPHLLRDERGTALLDSIAAQSPYPGTSARLLGEIGADLVAASRPVEILDGGYGAGLAVGPLLDAALAAGCAPRCTLALPEQQLLERMFDLQLEHPGIPVVGMVGDLARDAALIGDAGGRIVTMLGGCFDGLPAPEASAFLRGTAARLGPGDLLVLAVGLPPKGRVLEPRGPRGWFEEQLTQHALEAANHAYGADFERGSFTHRWRYEARGRRLLSLLRASRPLSIYVRDAALRIEFPAGRELLVRAERKFNRASVQRLAAESGLALERWCPAPEEGVGLAVLRAPETAHARKAG